MATYQSRHRDPLLDSNTQAALERRGRELLGLCLVVIGVMAGLMVASYSPDDPNWMLASDAPVHNIMGRWGAAIAAPMFMILGRASWMIAIVIAAWGLRFMTHRGEDRALSRAVIAPLAVLATSLYCATLTPPEGWVHSFGLGGLLGDTVLSVVLTLLPIPALTSVRIMALILGPLALWLSAFGLGFTRAEVRQGLRFLGLGAVMIYDLALKGMGQGAAAGVRAAQTAQETYRNRADTRPGNGPEMRPQVASVVRSAVAARRAAEMTPEPELIDEMPAWSAQPRPQPAPVIRYNEPTMAEPPLRAPVGQSQPSVAAAPVRAPLVATRNGTAPLAAPTMVEPAPEHRPGLLSRLGLGRRHDAAEAHETSHAAALMTTQDPAENRVQTRITDAIRARAAAAAQPAPQPTGFRIEPALTVGRGPKPLVLPTAAMQAPQPELVDEPMPYYEDDALEWAPYDDEPYDDTMSAYAAPEVPSARVIQPTPRSAVAPSKQARKEAQPALPFEPKVPAYEPPPLSLLMNPRDIMRHHLSDEALEENARMLESVLDDYGVKGEIVAIRPGPVVTMYELEPAPGLKASRVIGLSDDIARSMSALSARVSTVPGRSVIGIELPNVNREKVVLREILSARDFGDSNMRLPLALGKDIGGDPIVANLAKMPHLLIAGTTGSGKSVAINTMILSLLYKLTPEECRLIMIDPKMLELSVYDGIPHLLSPVVTDPKKAVVALKWVVGEMEERYRKMSKMGVRNIEGYNGRVRDALSKNEMFSRTIQTGFDDETGDPIFETEAFAPEVLPYIVVIVDEMADLMMVAGKEIEACIQRLAQMARASGIHLIMATQRPSVDVITGTIKANFPTRISFQVTSKIDSRTILGEQGAEQLLGMGDMLYMAGGARITRVHGPFVSDEEVEEIVSHLKGFGPPEYVNTVVEGHDDDREAELDLVLGLGAGEGDDALYDQAVAIVIKDRKCSTSYIQRKLAIGYNKAARLVEQMEDEGVVSSANHVGKREILVPEGH